MNLTQLTEQWLIAAGGHLRPRSVAAYRACLTDASQYITDLNGNLSAGITAWQSKRRAELAGASFALALTVLKSCLTWGKTAGHVTAPDCWSDIRPGKYENQQFTIPSRKQFDAIVAEIRRRDPECADFCEFLAASGCRKSEAWGLQWRDYDQDTGTLLIARNGGKTGSRTLPRMERVCTVLDRLHRGDDSAFIFGKIEPKARLDGACRRLGIPHVRTHDCRHFAAVQWLKAAGINRASILARYMGHSTEQFLNRYSAHCTDAEYNEVAALLK